MNPPVSFLLNELTTLPGFINVMMPKFVNVAAIYWNTE